MTKKQKFVLGLIVFIVASLLPLYAISRYTGVGLAKFDEGILDTTFHVLLIISLLMFYAQWKICPDIWIHIRFWFADHVWSIMFGLTVVLIIHSLLFVRLYPREFARYRTLRSNIIDCKDKLDSLEEAVKNIDVSGNVSDVIDTLDSMKKDIKNMRDVVDDIQYRLQQSGELKNGNHGWETKRRAPITQGWY